MRPKLLLATNNAGKVNEFKIRKINKDELDEEWISEVIKENKVNTTVAKVVKELTTGRHMVVQYMGEWAEDYRQLVYSKELGSSVWLLSQYDME